MSFIADLIVGLFESGLKQLSSSIDFQALLETASSKGSSALEGLSSKIEAGSSAEEAATTTAAAAE
ncbi:hypothetical protein Q0N61_10855 [Corynebacterium sanguinis]|uniref:hypothetical protein n=1 Tax=Corynebacterium sanguinis TaxID=2594913 RepID=UPI00265015FC|nr:hypothetical protein [Corynebacterium sanguinis]MDN8623268.1 hypothetical protein [Corynebacterium sanguinis]